MNFISLFTSFSGRINRAKWWLGIIILGVLSIALQFAVNPEGFMSGVPTMTVPQLIISLVIYIPVLAIVFKRLNDRNWPSWVGIAYAVIMFGTLIAQYFALNSAMETILSDPTNPENAMTAMKALLPISIVQMVVGLALLIDNGMLRGTAGPNQYGEDPLAHKNTDVA